ncbi:Cysteine-rich secretory protein family protein [Desulfonatronum zhilinae]|nr:Cysteine-rich secretory protein family protein [Desulfonatronum zhilinae]
MNYLRVVFMVIAIVSWLSPTPSFATEKFAPETIIKLTNAHRLSLDLEPLQENQQLIDAAQLRVEDMIGNGYFAHMNPETGEGPKEALEETGYRVHVFAENIAKGNWKNNEELVQGWLDSPEHRENIELAEMQEIGVAIVRGDDSNSGLAVYYGVQLFGSQLPKHSEIIDHEVHPAGAY